MNMQEMKEFFKNDRFATEQTGISIDSVSDDGVICSFVIEPHHLAAHGGVMGGAIYTLADFAFAVAANREKMTMTTTATIHYMGRARGKRLIAECRKIRDGRTICIFETRIRDELDNEVALVVTEGMHMV